MLTADDIKKLITSFSFIFTTREDLNKLEDRFILKFQDILTKLDAVYKEVKDMRIDLEEEISLVKQRVSHLETKTAAN